MTSKTNFKHVLYTALAWTGLAAGTFSSGCATTAKSLVLGGSIGAGAGAIVGGLADTGKDGENRTRNVIVGSALGGVAGMMASGLLYGAGEGKRREGFEAGKKAGVAPQPGAIPALSQPKVEAKWVESRVIGNRYIEGHFEYVITEPTRWETAQ